MNNRLVVTGYNPQLEEFTVLLVKEGAEQTVPALNFVLASDRAAKQEHQGAFDQALGKLYDQHYMTDPEQWVGLSAEF